MHEQEDEGKIKWQLSYIELSILLNGTAGWSWVEREVSMQREREREREREGRAEERRSREEINYYSSGEGRRFAHPQAQARQVMAEQAKLAD